MLKEPELQVVPVESETKTNEDRVRELAYQLWLERGQPIGSPEVDWFDALEKVKKCPS